MVVSRVGNSDTFTVTTPSDCEIRMTRLFDAPPAAGVRGDDQARARPAVVGILDAGHSVPVCEIDLRPGGQWRFVGRGPTGDIPAFYGVFREIVPPERLVQTECFEPFPDAESVVTTLLTEEDGKTRVTVTSVYPSKDVRDMVLRTGMEKGAAISYDRLEDVANELATGRTR